MHVLEYFSSFLEGRGVEIPGHSRRSSQDLVAEQKVCRSPATRSAEPDSYAAVMLKVEARACSQIGFAQRGTGCSGARFHSRFTAGKVKC